MTTDEETVDLWWENEPLPENAQKVDEALKELSDFEKADAILKMLSHNGEAMKIVRGRMVYEIRQAIISGVKEEYGSKSRNLRVAEIDRLLGKLLTQEAECVMEKEWADEYILWKSRGDE